mmetsp:Transcript_25493/g.69015  ORF Transcript_25493/g.69015 Transcript_25493/m.69015 type:complete len:209 (+) Transcript_25493:831-1457(+)
MRPPCRSSDGRTAASAWPRTTTMATCSRMRWRRSTAPLASSPPTSSASATTARPSRSLRHPTALWQICGTRTSAGRRRASTPWAWPRPSSGPCATLRTWIPPTRPLSTTTPTSSARPCIAPWSTGKARATCAGPTASPQSSSSRRWPGASTATSRWAPRRRRSAAPLPCAPVASSGATMTWTRRPSRSSLPSTTSTLTAASTCLSSWT